jgi:hypothetical protein
MYIILFELPPESKEDGGSRSVGTDGVESNQDLLNKPGSFFRSRHTARVRLAHPLIAIPGDNTVDHISKRPGNDDEGIHPGPNPGKAAKNFEGRRGFREDLPVFKQ